MKMTPKQIDQINSRTKNYQDAVKRHADIAKQIEVMALGGITTSPERWSQLFTALDTTFQAVKGAQKLLEKDYEQFMGVKLP